VRRAAPLRGVNAGVPVSAMQTYSLIRPAGSADWWRPASCEDVECAPYLYGWRTSVDQMTPLGNQQAAYIRRESGRTFSEHFDPATGLTVFEFVAGQPCFASGSHRRAVEREPLYVVRGGDHRGNPLARRRVHDRPEHWTEDFQTNQDRIQTVRSRG
jgi:hypothetical protein